MTMLDSMEAILKGDSTVTEDEIAQAKDTVGKLMELADEYRDWSRRRAVQSELEAEGRADADDWYALDDEAVEQVHAVFALLGENES